MSASATTSPARPATRSRASRRCLPRTRPRRDHPLVRAGRNGSIRHLCAFALARHEHCRDGAEPDARLCRPDLAGAGGLHGPRRLCHRHPDDEVRRELVCRLRALRPHHLLHRHPARLPGAQGPLALPRLRHPRLLDADLASAAQRAMADRRRLRHRQHQPADLPRPQAQRRAGISSLPGRCDLHPGAGAVVARPLALGRAFMALRENPVRAASLGVDTRAYTLLAFAIGSAYGGFAGALYAPLVEFIDPSPSRCRRACSCS